MKKWFAILLCTAMLLVPVTAYADECTGSCPDTSFIGQCEEWVDSVVTAVANALGIHVNVSGTVGPLYNTASQEVLDGYRVRVALDGGYQCAACNNTDNVTLPAGTQVYDQTFVKPTPGPYSFSIDMDIAADTSIPHTIGVYTGQTGCANCPSTDSVEVEPYVQPTPESCEVQGGIWYECTSGAWLYGTGIMRDCVWCGGLTGRRVVKETYDCGEHYTWYDNGEKVDGPPQELGRYPCPGDCK